MTTIAGDARAGVLVADSKATVEGTCWLPCTKLYRFDDEIVGVCGDVMEEAKWLAWRRNGKRGRFPKLGDSFQALALRPSGLYLLGEDGSDMLIERGFHAIGTGGHAAIAVLIHGGDARTAVDIACQIDINSGGDIVVEHLERKP